jgi:transporter family protein
VTRYSIYPLLAAVFAAISLVLTEITIEFYGVDPILAIILGNLAGGGILLLASTGSPLGWAGTWPWRPLARIATGALCIYALAYLMAFNAIALIGAGKMALLGQLESPFVVILAIIFLGEALTFRRGIAGLFVLAGTVLINFNPRTLELSLGWGEVLATLAPVSVATGIIILKPVFDAADARRVTGLALVLGAVYMTLFIPVFVSSFELSGAALVAIGLMGLFRGLSWLAYNLGLKRIGASRSAIVFISFAFFTVMFQAVIARLAPAFGLQLPTNLSAALLGGGIIAAGIIILQRDPVQVRSESPARRRRFFI